MDAIPLVAIRGRSPAGEVVTVERVVPDREERRPLAEGEAMGESEEGGVPGHLGAAAVLDVRPELMAVREDRGRWRPLHLGIEDGGNVDGLCEGRRVGQQSEREGDAEGAEALAGRRFERAGHGETSARHGTGSRRIASRENAVDRAIPLGLNPHPGRSRPAGLVAPASGRRAGSGSREGRPRPTRSGSRAWPAAAATRSRKRAR